MKIFKKHTEIAMRQAAINNGCKGRSITSGAVENATREAGEIVDEFFRYIEESMPPLYGRGSRINSNTIRQVSPKFKLALMKALREIRVTNKPTEEEE